MAFFAGLMSNFGPISRPEDVKFGAVVTNYGFGYNDNSGRFVAPFDGTYMFHVTIAAQGEQRVRVHNGFPTDSKTKFRSEIVHFVSRKIGLNFFMYRKL